MQEKETTPQEYTTHERVAMLWLRALAGFGLVCLLALIAWTLVYGIRLVPKAGEGFASVISSLFTKAPAESLSFSVTERAISDGKETIIRWEHTNTSSTSVPYTFSYSCSTKGLSVLVRREGVLMPLSCATPLTLIDTHEVAVVATLPYRGFEDITFTVSTGTLSTSTTIAILNTNVEDVGPATTTTATTTKKSIVEQTYTITPIPTPTPIAITPMQKQSTLLYDGKPADLVLEILDTGIREKGTFYPVSPIPSRKTAAVRFAVTNRGGAVSGSWFFTARLPVEGDSSYKYVSAVQPALYPLSRVEFTLTFDEVLRAEKGTIQIALSPTQETDDKSNNISEVHVEIRP